MSDTQVLDKDGNPIHQPSADEQAQARKKEMDDLSSQIKQANEKSEKAEERAKRAEDEMFGTRRELHRQREERQTREEETETEVADDDYVTGKQMKKMRETEQKRAQVRDIQYAEISAGERFANDEIRMEELIAGNPTKYSEPYNEVIDKFAELAAKDPSLWSQINAEKYRPGGKPAQLAYRISLREHPDYQDMHEKRGRKKLLDEMDVKGDRPRRLSSAGGGNIAKPENMTDADIANMSDADLDKLLVKHG